VGFRHYFASEWWPTDIVCKSPQTQSRFVWDGQDMVQHVVRKALQFDFCRFTDSTSWLLQLSINYKVFSCDKVYESVGPFDLGALTRKKNQRKVTEAYTSRTCREIPSRRIATKFGAYRDLAKIINRSKFHVDRSRVLGFTWFERHIFP
jgi:hypothetical protein